jgi:FkbM family methyltransferase
MSDSTLSFQITGPNGYGVPIVIFDTPIGRAIAKGILEGTSYPIIPFIKNVNTVIDIGANVGLSAIWFSKNYPASRILAIEPSPMTFVLLQRNMQHWPKIEAYNVGLHTDTHTADMFLGSKDAVTNSIARSALNTELSVPVSLEDAEEFLASKSTQTIDILKLDTEGCERPILDRIRSRMPRIRVLYVEYHSEEDRRWIDNLMASTHVLSWGRIEQPHRGEVCYVARNAYPSPEDADRLEIRLDNS